MNSKRTVEVPLSKEEEALVAKVAKKKGVDSPALIRRVILAVLADSK